MITQVNFRAVFVVRRKTKNHYSYRKLKHQQFPILHLYRTMLNDQIFNSSHDNCNASAISYDIEMTSSAIINGQEQFLDEDDGSRQDPLRNTTTIDNSAQSRNLLDGTRRETAPPRNRQLLFISLTTLLFCGSMALTSVVSVFVTLAVSDNNNANNNSNKSANSVDSREVQATSSPITTTTVAPESSFESDMIASTSSPSATTSKKPFGDSTIPSFAEAVTDSYSSRADLEVDLTMATKDMVNDIILRNVEQLKMLIPTNTTDDVATDNPMVKTIKQRTEVIANKFESRTSNNEDYADEADTIKEDGSFVYAAYGDYLVVWNRQGVVLAQEQIPLPPSGIRASIHAIQLTPAHVLVIAGGYSELDESATGSIADFTNDTKIQVYTKPTVDVPQLMLVATQSINGVYKSSHVLEDKGSTIHLVTGANVNLYSQLEEPLSILNFVGAASNHTHYLESASALARDTLIPAFVTLLANRIMPDDTTHVMKVNNWKNEDQNVDNSGSKKGFHSYVQVVSLPTTALPTSTFAAESLAVSKSTFLSPTIDLMHVYGIDDSLVIAVEPSSFDWATKALIEDVFLVHLKVDPDTTKTSIYSVAAFQGRLAGSDIKTRRHSIDIRENDLRMALTRQASFPFDRVYAICGDPHLIYKDVQCTTMAAWESCRNLVWLQACQSVTKSSCPYEYTCADDETTVSAETSTKNIIMVLSISETGFMKEIGRVDVGANHEVVTSVHFGETFSYVTTSFLQSQGPFYVLNIPQGEPPSISSTLQLENLISYLRPLNEDDTLLLGIGQNVTGQGDLQDINGIVVSVIDVSDPEAPVLLASRMLAHDDDSSVSMLHAQWDAKSVQYTSDGLLIIPYMYAESMPELSANVDLIDRPEPFQGFAVLNVSDPKTNDIQEVFRVDHRNPSGACRYCAGNLHNHRALVYADDGSIMTISNHKVVSSDLTTGAQNWAFNVTVSEQDNLCCS